MSHNISFEVRMQHLKDATVSAGKSLTEPDDDWIGVMVMSKGNDQAIMPLTYESDLEKELFAERVMPLAIKMFKPDFVGQMQPAWAVKGEGAILSSDLPPSQHPERVEVLVLMGMTVDQVQFWSAEVKRSDDQPPTLGEWELWPTDAFHEGRFFDPIREALLEVAGDEE